MTTASDISPVGIRTRLATLLPVIPGWCSPEKADALVRIILTHRPSLCVEIGVFGGSSLIPQALALEALGQGVIYGIDPWENAAALEAMADEANRSWWSGVNLETIYQGCKSLLVAQGLASRCKLLRAKAEGIADVFLDGSIDLLHIDGNHSEELSVRDVCLYLPKVRPGGHIFFDDVTWTEGGVRTTGRAVAMALAECDHVEDVSDERSGSVCSVFRKRGGA